jgi:hypothetical protein
LQRYREIKLSHSKNASSRSIKKTFPFKNAFWRAVEKKTFPFKNVSFRAVEK